MLYFRILYFVSELCRSNRSNAFFCAASAAHFFILRGCSMKRVFLIIMSALLLFFCSCTIKTPPEETNLQNAEKALDSAKFYLAATAYSYSGLVAVLEKSGYTPEEAAFAAKNCSADWFKEASRSAKELLEFSTFTKEALIFQLQIKGFTAEEAEYGAEQNGY